jgi:hypothetical protein
MLSRFPERSLDEALLTWTHHDLLEVVIDWAREAPKSQLIDLIFEYGLLDDDHDAIIREAFPPTNQAQVHPVTKGVCQCGHLQSDHEHFTAIFDARVQRASIQACTVRNRDFRRCGCFNYAEDPAGEWTGNEETRVGWL